MTHSIIQLTSMWTIIFVLPHSIFRLAYLRAILLKNDTVMLVARFNTDVRCTEHNTNVEIGNGTS